MQNIVLVCVYVHVGGGNIMLLFERVIERMNARITIVGI